MVLDFSELGFYLFVCFSIADLHYLIQQWVFLNKIQI